MPVAQRGLESIGIAAADIDRYLGIIEKRISKNTSGAVWQLDTLERIRKGASLQQACHEMLERYHEFSQANLPVAQWD